MRQGGLVYVGVTIFLIQGISALAQSSIDALEQDLKQIKDEHEQINAQVMTNFLSQLDAASRSSDAAVALYQQAGGLMPNPVQVTSQYVNETPDEKATRLAQDQDNLSRIGEMVQLHCGLMRFGGLFITSPNQKGLHDDWVAWLKTAAQMYPQLKGTEGLRGTVTPASDQPEDGKRKRWQGQGGESKDIGDWKAMTLRDSIISKYLAFQSWGDKEQGGWAVKDLPRLYRSEVLDPLRAAQSIDTLAAWDTYIAMRNADQPDSDKWNTIDSPDLMFDRDSDDYQIAPSTEKLETLMGIIKANPTHPKQDDWIARLQKAVQDYRSRKSGEATTSIAGMTATAPSTPANPNVTVTTTTQGDMTIITTHTNAPSSNAPQPPPGP